MSIINTYSGLEKKIRYSSEGNDTIRIFVFYSHVLLEKFTLLIGREEKGRYQVQVNL